jgi:hypothetical protein
MTGEGWQTLFRGHICQFIRGTCVEREAPPIIAILENNSQPIGSLHQYLNDCEN